MSAALATLLLLSGLSLAGVASFLDRDLLARSPALTADLLSTPLLAFLSALAAFWLYIGRRLRGLEAWAGLAALVLAAYGLAARPFSDYRDSLGEAARLAGLAPLRVWLLILTAAVLSWILRLLSQRVREWRAASAFACAGAALALFSWTAPVEGVGVNRFGLAAYPAGAVVRASYNGDGTEPYPAGSYAYNSLGYRDVEPAPPKAGGKRVLLVGGFFLSGLGVAANEETLPALLRRELAGRAEVMAAAFPCNGLYGYDRTIRALAPVYRPTSIVIGYAGDLDDAALDSQAVVDRTSSSPWLRRVVPVLRLRDYVHTKATRHEVQFLTDRRLAAELSRLAQLRLDGLEAFAAERGIELVFLHYRPDFGRLRFSPAVRQIRLPDELQYKGGPNEYWYAQEGTPRPAFNRKLAVLLAGRLGGPR